MEMHKTLLLSEKLRKGLDIVKEAIMSQMTFETNQRSGYLESQLAEMDGIDVHVDVIQY